MAVTYVPHLRMSYGGRLGQGTDEIWSNTVNWATLGLVPNPEQLQAAADALRAPLSAWINRSQSYVNQAAWLDYVKLNWIQADGKQRDVNTILAEMTGVRGGSSGQTPPYYQTAAITLRTRSRRGRGHAGRVFPPVVQFQTDTSNPLGPYMSRERATEMATSYQTLLVACRTAMATAFGGAPVPDPIVVSAGNTVGGVAPGANIIISTVVDRVMDVQHRRTNRVGRAEGDEVLLDA